MNFAENEHKILKFWKKILDKRCCFDIIEALKPTALSVFCWDGGLCL